MRYDYQIFFLDDYDVCENYGFTTNDENDESDDDDDVPILKRRKLSSKENSKNLFHTLVFFIFSNWFIITSAPLTKVSDDKTFFSSILNFTYFIFETGVDIPQPPPPIIKYSPKVVGIYIFIKTSTIEPFSYNITR